jgi:hypothetical protein
MRWRVDGEVFKNNRLRHRPHSSSILLSRVFTEIAACALSV